MRVAVIPARGGSKRIPHKNIKPFCGKPMIAWSIEAAQRSQCFDRVIVSTDDDEIAEISQSYGAEIPFIRPSSLSDDYTATLPVITHAIDWLEQNACDPSVICCIYATAPFLTEKDLRQGFELLSSSDECDYAFAVTSYGFPIQRAFRITEQGCICMFNPEMYDARSQDLEEAWHDAGQFYWGRKEAWISQKPIFSAQSAPVVLPRHRVQDIDTLEDWKRAELMYKTLYWK